MCFSPKVDQLRRDTYTIISVGYVLLCVYLCPAIKGIELDADANYN